MYPPGWRERYEEEFAAMLERHQMSLVDVLDTVLGALDARLNPPLENGRMSMVNRMRAATIAVLCAYVGFVVAGMGFQKATEDLSFTELERTHTLSRISHDAIVAGCAVALLTIVAGGAPIAFAALRRAIAERRWDIPLLFAVPPLSLAIFVGYVLLLTGPVYAAIGPLAVHDPLNVALALSLFGLFLLAAIASTVAISVAVIRSEISARLYRFALVPGAVTAVGMLVTLVSTLVWSISLRADAPQIIRGNGGVLATNFAVSLLGIYEVMLVATCVAGISIVRGLAARTADITV